MALLSMVAERGFPFENPLSWTWHDLCRRMGLPSSGRRDVELKRAIRATWGLRIFGMERLDGRVRETWRRLYAECEFRNDARADGSVADANRLWLAPWYLDSLNELHAVPVDYDLWKRLERVAPLASRLYEYLIPSFFKREVLELSYDRLASAMPVVSEDRRSHAIRQFATALEALQAEGIVAGSAWDAMKGTGRPKLILNRGPRLTPRTPTEPTADAAPAIAPAEAIDPALESRVIEEFYRLLGKRVRPLRSDRTVARAVDCQGGHRAGAPAAAGGGPTAQGEVPQRRDDGGPGPLLRRGASTRTIADARPRPAATATPRVATRTRPGRRRRRRG